MHVRTRNYTVHKNQFFSILLILCSIFFLFLPLSSFFFNSGHSKQFLLVWFLLCSFQSCSVLLSPTQSCSVMSCSQLLLSAVLNNGLLEDNKSKLEQVSIYVFSSKLQSCYQILLNYLPTGCVRQNENHANFKIVKELTLVLKQTIPQQKALNLSFNLTP